MKYVVRNTRLFVANCGLSLYTLYSPLECYIQHSLASFYSYALYASQNTLVRIRKAPYPDSYWFLYSSKLTYYTDREI